MTRPSLASWWFKVSIGYAAAAVLLWLFLRNTEWHALVDGLQSVGWPILAAAVVIRLVSLVVASLRWQALLEPASEVPLHGVVTATMMGMAASAVAPMPAAEFVRPYLLSRRHGVDLGATLATTMVEWCLDGFAVVTLFIVALMGLRASEAGTAREPWFVVALVTFLLLALIALALLRFLPQWSATAADWMHRHGAVSGRTRLWITTSSASFSSGLRLLEHRRGLIIVATYSFLFAAMTAVSSWLTLTAFGLPVSFGSGFLVMGLVTVAGVIPTPGAIGGFHAVCQLGLVNFFQLDRARTVLPVIAMHAVLYLPGALLGALCFVSMPSRPWRVRT